MIFSTVYFLTGNYFQMNSGLPSLLDAIFGKKDLASVSLDEMYEVINEFPSFNAAHFLLSKKLGLDNDASYEKESMRTALYFNNQLWLQSMLEEENHSGVKRIPEVKHTIPAIIPETILVENDPVNAGIPEIINEENETVPADIPEIIYEEIENVPVD